MIKSDFWHFQAVWNGQIWYIKKKASLWLHFEGLTDLTSNYKTHLWEGHMENSLILYCSDD